MSREVTGTSFVLSSSLDGVDGPSLRFPRAARENAMWLIVRFRTNLGRLCQMNCRYDCGVRRWWCGLGEA